MMVEAHWWASSQARGVGHILIVSPIPSHPTTHGNRARLLQFALKLRARGFFLTLIYTGSEGLSETSEAQMRGFWDHMVLLPPTPGKRKINPDREHQLDDWADDRLPAVIEEFCAVWHVDAVIVNYVWLSACLDAVPQNIVKIIDTHDVFGDRHAALRAQGVKVSFFSTSAAEEGQGLDRADLVIAIQDSEAKILAKRTRTPVKTLGHSPQIAFLPKRRREENTPLTVGYFASENPLNQHATKLLIEALEKDRGVLGRADWLLAGSICGTESGSRWPGRRVSWVDSPRDFYETVDIVINPHMGGTGLKIKSVEALTYGRPLVGTIDATVGLPTEHPLHRETDPTALVKAVDALCASPQDIDDLTAHCHKVITEYDDMLEKQVDDVFPNIAKAET